MQEEAGLDDGWVNVTAFLPSTATAEASVCCALTTLRHAVFLFSQITAVRSILYLYPKTAGMGASDPTTRSAGEAVMENWSMDNL